MIFVCFAEGKRRFHVWLQTFLGLQLWITILGGGELDSISTHYKMWNIGRPEGNHANTHTCKTNTHAKQTNKNKKVGFQWNIIIWNTYIVPQLPPPEKYYQPAVCLCVCVCVCVCLSVQRFTFYIKIYFSINHSYAACIFNKPWCVNNETTILLS